VPGWSYAHWRERGKTEGPGLSWAKLSSVVKTPRSRRCYESRISAKWYRASCYFNNGTTVFLCVYVLYDMVGYRVASKHVFRKRNWRIDWPFAHEADDFAILWRVSLEMTMTQYRFVNFAWCATTDKISPGNLILFPVFHFQNSTLFC